MAQRMTESFALPYAQPITISYLDEARAILDSIRRDDYPPTNPALLLKAARFLYLEGHDFQGAYEVVQWTEATMRRFVNGNHE